MSHVVRALHGAKRHAIKEFSFNKLISSIQ